MATINDSAKAIIAQRPWLKTALGLLFAVLTYGKSKGLFQKEDGVK
jgi:hypothetical protein